MGDFICHPKRGVGITLQGASACWAWVQVIPYANRNVIFRQFACRFSRCQALLLKNNAEGKMYPPFLPPKQDLVKERYRTDNKCLSLR